MHDLIIRKEEFADWLADHPHVISPLLEGYKAAIFDMGDDLLNDPRSSMNVHVLNADFTTEQRYFMGFHTFPGRPEFVLSCLYVYPKFRGKGFSKYLIDTAKIMVNDRGFIQAAVEKEKIDYLDSFYKNQGFISTDDIISNSVGMAYRDYFWSGKKFELSRAGTTILVKPV